MINTKYSADAVRIFTPEGAENVPIPEEVFEAWKSIRPALIGVYVDWCGGIADRLIDAVYATKCQRGGISIHYEGRMDYNRVRGTFPRFKQTLYYAKKFGVVTHHEACDASHEMGEIIISEIDKRGKVTWRPPTEQSCLDNQAVFNGFGWWYGELGHLDKSTRAKKRRYIQEG